MCAQREQFDPGVSEKPDHISFSGQLLQLPSLSLEAHQLLQHSVSEASTNPTLKLSDPSQLLAPNVLLPAFTLLSWKKAARVTCK